MDTSTTDLACRNMWLWGTKRISLPVRKGWKKGKVQPEVTRQWMSEGDLARLEDVGEADEEVER